MKKKITTFIFTFCCFWSVFANPNDTIFTVYQNGEFITTCKVEVNASDSISHTVINDFLNQTRYDLDKLFNWALKGLKLRGEKNELIVFNFKSTKYNKTTEILHSVGDVSVPYIITFPDISVDSKLTKSKGNKGNILVDIEVLYSDAFLKKTYGYFITEQKKNNKTVYTLKTHVQFGWFFNIFITQHRFKQIMEWRFKKLLKNIQIEAERREKALL